VSKLTRLEINKLVYKYIGVTGGYLSDFSYRTHREFYALLELDVDPDAIEGNTCSRFITILSGATSDLQARILLGILEKYPAGSTPNRSQKLYDEIVGWIDRLNTGTAVVLAPPSTQVCLMVPWRVVKS
jgi:hypothetical protein